MLDKEFGVEPVDPLYRGEVAKRWQYKDGTGEIGVIASVTQPFCGDCTRSRLSAEGKLYTCLFAVRGHDLRALIRGGATDDEIADKLARDLARPRRPLLRAPRREHRRPCDRRAQGRDVVHRRLDRRGKPAVFPHGPPFPRLTVSDRSWWLVTAPLRRRLALAEAPAEPALQPYERVFFDLRAARGPAREVRFGYGVGSCSWTAVPAARLVGPASPDRDLARVPARLPARTRCRRPAARGGVLQRAQGRLRRDELQRPALRAHAAAVRRAAPLAGVARELDVLDVRVHRAHARAALALRPAARQVRELPQHAAARQRDRPARLHRDADRARRGCSGSGSPTSRTRTGSSSSPPTPTPPCRACTPPTR